MKIQKRFIVWWMPIAEMIGNFMNRVILSIFYFIAVLPFGLVVRLFCDPLQIKKKRVSGWTDFVVHSDDLDRARRQF